MGGVQYGIPLRGYEEFSITPDGYNPFSSSSRASANAFGQSYAAFTVEVGARMSQSLYVNTLLRRGQRLPHAVAVRPRPASTAAWALA